MTIANLEKLCRLIKKNDDNPPPPPLHTHTHTHTHTPHSSEVEGTFAPKKSPENGYYFLAATRRPRNNHGGR